MSKGRRNREIRRQALAIKEDHASDPRTTKAIARAIRRNGSPNTRGTSERGSRWLGVPKPKMSTIKSKLRRK